jgi:four helix bundle protein
MAVRSYRDLVVWQKGLDLVASVYTVTAVLPRDELFGLTSQMRRAAVSIVANVAEGSGRTRKEFLHHIVIARGSQKELEALTLVCTRLGYLTEQNVAESSALQDEVARMLWSLKKSLSRA